MMSLFNFFLFLFLKKGYTKNKITLMHITFIEKNRHFLFTDKNRITVLTISISSHNAKEKKMKHQDNKSKIRLGNTDGFVY